MIINTLPCNSLQCWCQGSWIAWLPACLIMLQWIRACRSFCQMPLWSWNLIIFGLEEVKSIWNLESRHLTSLRLWNHSSPIAPTLMTTPQFVSIRCITRLQIRLGGLVINYLQFASSWKKYQNQSCAESKSVYISDWIFHFFIQSFKISHPHKGLGWDL